MTPGVVPLLVPDAACDLSDASGAGDAGYAYGNPVRRLGAERSQVQILSPRFVG
jgi:hypothetical protein